MLVAGESLLKLHPSSFTRDLSTRIQKLFITLIRRAKLKPD